MRSLLISILSLVILVGGWLIFAGYSDRSLDEMINKFDDSIMPAIESEDWDNAYDDFDKLYDDWHDYRKKAFYFLDTEDINNADYSFARTLKYIKAEDVSNSSGELLALKEELKFLYENEKVNGQNIL